MASKLKVTPLHDRVIIRPAKAEEKTAGGITWCSGGSRPR
jgi:chaperonin GroES